MCMHLTPMCMHGAVVGWHEWRRGMCMHLTPMCMHGAVVGWHEWRRGMRRYESTQRDETRNVHACAHAAHATCTCACTCLGSWTLLEVLLRLEAVARTRSLCLCCTVRKWEGALAAGACMCTMCLPRLQTVRKTALVLIGDGRMGMSLVRDGLHPAREAQAACNDVDCSAVSVNPCDEGAAPAKNLLSSDRICDISCHLWTVRTPCSLGPACWSTV
jgi:hypothetical protein